MPPKPSSMTPVHPEGFVLDAVARLVERSMVIVEPGSPTRYRMLETLRQYAAERLARQR